MTPEQENQWREEFIEFSGNKDSIYPYQLDMGLYEYGEHSYIAARKKAQEEIDGLNEKLAFS